MSKISPEELKRLKAVDFAQQITRLTKPEVFEKAMDAVKTKDFAAFKEVCKKEKINSKAAEKLWKELSEISKEQMDVGWDTGW